MDKKSSYLLKNTSILTICNFSSKILVFLLVPLYTSVLTTAEYGIYEIIMSTIQLLVPFLTLNVSEGVLRFLMDKDANVEQVKGIGLIFVSASIICFVTIILVNNYFDLLDTLTLYNLETILYYVAYVFNQLFIQTAKGEERVKDLGVAGVISTFVSLLMNVLLLVIIPFGLKGFFYAYILGQASSAFYLMRRVHFFGHISFSIRKDLLADLLKYSLPLIFVTLGWLINNVSDRYVVTWLCGLEQNGIYSVSYKIPTIITTVQNIFIQAWTISAIKEYENKERNQFYQNIFFKFNGLIVGCCSFLIITTKAFAKFLYSNDFYVAWQYVPFLLVSVVFGAASGFIGPILSAEKNSKALASSTFLGAIVNLVLNYILISVIGVQGAAVATLLSNIVIYVLRRLSIGNILIDRNYKKIIFSWILVSIQAVFMVLDYTIIIQLPVMILLLIVYWKIIKEVFLKYMLDFLTKKREK